MDVVIIGYTGCLQSATDDKIIGVKGVGKDSLAEAVDWQMYLKYEVVNISLADPLKDLVSKCFGLPRWTYDTPEMKESPLSEYPGWTYRKFLERVGTDVFRFVDPDIWIRLLKDRIEQEIAHPLSKTGVPLCTIQTRMDELGIPRPRVQRKIIQITDVRFKNEYEMLKSMGAKIVQVKRRVSESSNSSHVSNQFDPTMIPDVIVENNGSLEDLRQQVPKLLEQLNVYWYPWARQ